MTRSAWELYDWTDVSHRGSGSAAEAGRLRIAFLGNGIRAVAPLAPKGQRLYSDADLVVLRRIRTLLHEQGMTIEGARRVLERECAESGDGKARTSAEDMLRHVESELMALQALLGRQRLKPTR